MSNPPPLTLLCEISGALHLAQPGITAGWQAGRRFTGEFQNFQSWLNVRLITSFNQGTASLQPYQCIPAGILRKALQQDWFLKFFKVFKVGL